tara:strand:- start:503 stop:622 length:120 start_codon:yes stop_codon:yes gene_type:complete
MLLCGDWLLVEENLDGVMEIQTKSQEPMLSAYLDLLIVL